MKAIVHLASITALSIALSQPAFAQRRAVRTPTAVETLASANGAARQSPTASAFEDARQIYAYRPGALYEVYTSPNYVTTVLLEPGETLSTIAAGDTSRYQQLADSYGQAYENAWQQLTFHYDESDENVVNVDRRNAGSPTLWLNSGSGGDMWPYARGVR